MTYFHLRRFVSSAEKEHAHLVSISINKNDSSWKSTLTFDVLLNVPARAKLLHKAYVLL